jgi:CRISPR-associated protein Cas2
MSTRSPRLLCYDICCAKRLRKVHKIASEYMMAIQYSVFYAELFEHEVQKILACLHTVVDPDVDDVRIYRTRALQVEHALGKTAQDNGMLVFFPSGNRL